MRYKSIRLKNAVNTVKNNRGDSYIDMVVFIIVILTAVVMTLNVYSYLTLKQDLDYVATEVVERAALEGVADVDNSEVKKLFESLCAEQGLSTDASLMTFTLTADDSAYFDRTTKEVQLGEAITLNVVYKTKFRGLGGLGEAIDIYCPVSKTSLSRVYWK